MRRDAGVFKSLTVYLSICLCLYLCLSLYIFLTLVVRICLSRCLTVSLSLCLCNRLQRSSFFFDGPLYLLKSQHSVSSVFPIPLSPSSAFLSFLQPHIVSPFILNFLRSSYPITHFPSILSPHLPSGTSLFILLLLLSIFILSSPLLPNPEPFFHSSSYST